MTRIKNDGRVRGVLPRPAPYGMILVDRAEAAAMAGVTVRTVTRWVSLGYLTKWGDNRGRVRFSSSEVAAMNRFKPDSPGDEDTDGTVKPDA